MHLLGDAAHPLLRIGGRAEDEIKRREAHAVVPAQGEHFEALEALARHMVKDP